MSDEVQSFIQNVAQGKNADALQSFHAAIGAKVEAAIDAKRVEVAQGMIQRYKDHANAGNENT